MKIVPPYNNGVDPEIAETDLPHPMKPEVWLADQQPRFNPLPQKFTPAKRNPVPVRSSAPLLEQQNTSLKQREGEGGRTQFRDITERPPVAAA